jgi:EpsG family
MLGTDFQPRNNKGNNYKSLILSLILLVPVFAALLSYSKIFGVGRDYEVYKEIFDSLLTNGCRSQSDAYIMPHIEFGFQELTCFLSQFSSDYDLVYAIEIFISVLIKTSVILLLLLRSNLKGSDILVRFAAILFVYFTRYYPLHEFTQIRVSLSTGFLLLSVVCFKNISDFYSIFKINNLRFLNLETKKVDKIGFSKDWKERKKEVIIAPEVSNLENSSQSNNLKLSEKIRIVSLSAALFVACSFHYSAIFIIPLLFIANRVGDKKQLITSMTIMLIICTLLSSFLVSGVGSALFSDRLYAGTDERINPFSVFKILDIVSFFVAFALVDLSTPIQIFCLSLLSYSLILFYSFILANLPDTYSFRFSEILVVFNIFLIVSIQNKSRAAIVAMVMMFTSTINLIFYINNNYFLPFSR